MRVRFLAARTNPFGWGHLFLTFPPLHCKMSMHDASRTDIPFKIVYALELCQVVDLAVHPSRYSCN